MKDADISLARVKELEGENDGGEHSAAKLWRERESLQSFRDQSVAAKNELKKNRQEYQV